MLFALPNLGPRRAGEPAVVGRLIGAAAADSVRLGYLFSGIPLGIVALTLNATRAPAPEARRKARVLLWGTVAGAMPIMVVSMAQLLFGLDAPSWLNTGAVTMASIFPISFGYAVVRHRVLDIPVLLKRSARYLLVRRGFAVLLVLLAATVTGVFTLIVSQLFEINVTAATAAGVAFGIAMSAGSAPLVRRATTRIDRAFFRSAYDATAILENLADEMRTASSRESLADAAAGEDRRGAAPGLDDRVPRGRGRAPAPVRVARARHAPAWLPVSVPFAAGARPRGQSVGHLAGFEGGAAAVPASDSNAEMLVPILRRDGPARGNARAGPARVRGAVLGRRQAAAAIGGERRRASSWTTSVSRRRLPSGSTPSARRCAKSRSRARCSSGSSRRSSRRCRRSTTRAAACRRSAWAATTTISWRSGRVASASSSPTSRARGSRAPC